MVEKADIDDYYREQNTVNLSFTKLITCVVVLCVALQLRLEKEAEQRLAQLAESAHDEAIV